jgi:hypothetical protein
MAWRLLKPHRPQRAGIAKQRLSAQRRGAQEAVSSAGWRSSQTHSNSLRTCTTPWTLLPRRTIKTASLSAAGAPRALRRRSTRASYPADPLASRLTAARERGSVGRCRHRAAWRPKAGHPCSRSHAGDHPRPRPGRDRPPAPLQDAQRAEAEARRSAHPVGKHIANCPVR